MEQPPKKAEEESSIVPKENVVGPISTISEPSEITPIKRKRPEINVTPTIPSGPTIIPVPPQTLTLEKNAGGITELGPKAPPNVQMREDTRRPPQEFKPTPENERVGLRADTRLGGARPMINVTPPQTPPPPRPPAPPQTPTAPTPMPQAPRQSLWDRWKKRLLIALGLGAATGVGTGIGKMIFDEDKPPTPAVAPTSGVELEAIKARMAQLEAERARAINQNTNTNTNTVNVERGARRERKVNRETSPEDIAAKLKAQMDEMENRHKDELAKIQAKLAEGRQLTADEAMIHNQNIQRNYPKSVNMGGYIVPGEIPRQ